ncbi:MAG: polysaccharide biosynthesis/export family protein [Bacteroidales bacterium]|nr:polysaccharide biosynthesis/export family protein [Candidatus Colimorpha merdihippi]
MKVVYKLPLIALVATVALTSCVTPGQVNYLQDMEHGSQIELENKFQAVVAPYDELNITVFSSNEELAKPFNIGRSAVNSGVGQGTHGSYIVDVNGNIQFPILGEVHVAGLSRLALQDSIKNMLVRGGYLVDAVVMIRFASFKIFFLGAEGGKVIHITNERCTFLEALAMCGDLSMYTNRNKIAVMREVDGKMVMRYLDPRSSSVFQDPFFMLQQNDFIITQKYNKATPRSEASRLVSWLSVGLSMLTLTTSLMNYVQRFTGRN